MGRPSGSGRLEQGLLGGAALMAALALVANAGAASRCDFDTANCAMPGATRVCASDTPECRRSPAWYEIQDLRANWRYLTIKWGAIVSLALVLAAALLRRRPERSRVIQWAALISGLDALLFVLVWVTKTI